MALGGPQDTYAPTLSGIQLAGSAVAGGTLTVTVASVVGYPTPVLTYQWVNENGPVADTGLTYGVTTGDEGHTVSCTVTATNEVGSATASAHVAIPVPPPPTPTPTPTPTAGGVTTTTPTPTAGGVTTTGGVVSGAPADLAAMTDMAMTPSGVEATPGGMGTKNYYDEMRTMVEDAFPSIQHALEDIGHSTIAAGTDVGFVEVGAEVGLEIDDIGAVAVAGAFLLGTYIFGKIEQWVADLFPDPSIPIVHWHPLGFIKTGLHNLGEATDKAAAYWAHKLWGLIYTPVRQLLGLFQRGGNATAKAHNKVTHLHNVTIPAAQAKALADANKYTDNAQTAIQDQLAQAEVMLSPPISEAQAKGIIANAKRFKDLGWSFMALVATAIVSTDEYAKQLHQETGTRINTVTKKITTEQDKALQDFQTQITARLTADEATLAGLPSSIGATVPPSVTTAINTAVNNQQQVFTKKASALQTQLDALQSQVTAANDQIASDITAIEAAQRTINTLESQPVPDTKAIKAEQAKITKLQVDVATNTTTISTVISRINIITKELTDVQTAQRLNTLQLAPYEVAGGTALATVIATLTKEVSKLKKFTETCAVQVCDPQSPTYAKNVLKDLLGAVSAGAEIAFLVQAVRDPIGTAQTLAPGLEGIDQAAVDALDALLSL